MRHEFAARGEMSTFREPDGFRPVSIFKASARLSLGVSALLILLLSALCWGGVVSAAMALAVIL
jgi:hypothetical protein